MHPLAAVRDTRGDRLSWVVGCRRCEAPSVRWRAQSRQRSDRYTFDLIEAAFIAPAIVELCCAGRGVVRHRRGLEISRYASRAEAVVAELRADARRRGAPASTSSSINRFGCKCRAGNVKIRRGSRNEELFRVLEG